MKIIKKGENWCAPTFTEVMVECDRCGSKLEIEAEDVMESNGVAFFECPVCFKQNKMVNDVGAMYWNWKNYMDKKKWENERVKKSIMSDIERELDKAFQEDDVIMKDKVRDRVAEEVVGELIVSFSLR